WIALKIIGIGVAFCRRRAKYDFLLHARHGKDVRSPSLIIRPLTGGCPTWGSAAQSTTCSSLKTLHNCCTIAPRNARKPIKTTSKHLYFTTTYAGLGHFVK